MHHSPTASDASSTVPPRVVAGPSPRSAPPPSPSASSPPPAAATATPSGGSATTTRRSDNDRRLGGADHHRSLRRRRDDHGLGWQGHAPKKADPSLSKIKIGLINQEAGSTGAFPEIAAANKAVVEYINDQLGGVDGHAIEIDKCVADGTVASSQKCASQMVSDNVLYVTGGLDNNMQAWYPILGPAKIPVVGGIPVAGADFTAANSFMFIGGGAVAYPGPGRLHAEVPAERQEGRDPGQRHAWCGRRPPARAKPLEASGVTVTDLKVPATQADWLAPFASLKDMDAIMVLISPPNCISVAKARDSQQSQVPMVSVEQLLLEGGARRRRHQRARTAGRESVLRRPAGHDARRRDVPDRHEAVRGRRCQPQRVRPGGVLEHDDRLQQRPDRPSARRHERQISTQMVDPAGGQVFMGPKYRRGAADNPYSAICNYNLQWFAINAGKLTNPTGFVDIRPTIKVAQS